jgi:hypothetical protein
MSSQHPIEDVEGREFRMTGVELEELISDCPQIFHMSERGAWANIRRRGLLSATALLDAYGVSGDARHQAETQIRAKTVDIFDGESVAARLRDQTPMSEAGLKRALPPEISPMEWRLKLNGLVFFWLTQTRLLRLANARSYRAREHEVIALDTRRFVEAFYDRIWLSQINSGCTQPFACPRDSRTFRRIPDYDYAFWRRRRPKGERVVELCVDYAVLHIEPFVKERFAVQGERRLGRLA